ncbi:MAG: Arm DNA-binding domain-containing protein [Candidatus Sedimenticola sp. (ex Thyasira tokunagai)]
MPLSVETIDSAKPGINTKGEATDKPYKMGDSGGLFLLVQPNGGKWWRFKYWFAGKGNQVSLGAYPQVSLTEARERRDSYRAMLADGINPSNYAKEQRAAQRAKEARQLAATRFQIDSDGALAFRLGTRRLTLTPSETAELRSFLDATRAVTPKVEPCR